jgi:hypothetical protein
VTHPNEAPNADLSNNLDQVFSNTPSTRLVATPTEPRKVRDSSRSEGAMVAEEHSGLSPIPAHPAVAPGPSVADPFLQGAVVSGRSLYWTSLDSGAERQVEAIANLLAWCRELPGIRIGIDPKGLGLIVRSVARQWTDRPLTRHDDELLNMVGALNDDAPVWHEDLETFAPYLEPMLGGIRSAAETGGYWWLEPDDSDLDWWVPATIDGLSSYSRMIDHLSDETQLIPYLMRHRFHLFAPLDCTALTAGLRPLAESLPQPDREVFLRDLDGVAAAGATAGDRLFWSWQLISMFGVRENIINTPLLAIWNYWPTSRQWAPAPGPQDGGLDPPPLPAADLATSLRTVMEHVEMLFGYAAWLNGMGISDLRFGPVRGLAPVFFLACPQQPPAEPGEYVSRHGTSIHPFVTTCLASPDPRAHGIAWGLLEGDLLALRREAITTRAYTARYLIFPTAAAGFPFGDAEESVIRLAQTVQFLEFDTLHATRETVAEQQPLANRHTVWGGTADRISQLLDRVLDLIPSASHAELCHLSTRCSTLSLVVGRLQARLTKTSSDAKQVRRQRDSNVSVLASLLETRLTISPLTDQGHFSLRDALADPYPVRSLRPLLDGLQNQTDGVVAGIERIHVLLGTALAEADRLAKERLAALTGRLTVFVGLLALLVALPDFIPGAQLRAETYPAWLPEAMNITRVERAARYLVLGGLLLFLGMLLVYMTAPFHLRLRPRAADPFESKVRRFNDAVDRAAAAANKAWYGTAGERAWSKVETIDGEAGLLLDDLWYEVDLSRRERERSPLTRLRDRLPGRRAGPSPVDEWLAGADRLRNAILLFDLAPDLIHLPRSLCVYRYKSGDFLERTMIADWSFESSLLETGFAYGDIRQLDEWLSTQDNQEAIGEMSVGEFCDALKQQGVSADPRLRDPSLWTGPIGGEPEASGGASRAAPSTARLVPTALVGHLQQLLRRPGWPNSPGAAQNQAGDGQHPEQARDGAVSAQVRTVDDECPEQRAGGCREAANHRSGASDGADAARREEDHQAAVGRPEPGQRQSGGQAPDAPEEVPRRV